MSDFYESIMEGLTEAVIIESFKQKMEDLGVPECYYSLFEPKEQAVCVEKTEGGWQVYVYERGNKYDALVYETLEEALIFIVRCFTKDKGQP